MHVLLVLVAAFWIGGIMARTLQISDEDPKLVTVRLNIDDEEFRHLNDEEFERKLLETLVTTLTKGKSDVPSHNFDDPEPTEEPTSLDSWSVVWYIASFGGLIGFFLIISCSEWCCRKNRSPSSAYPRSSSSPVPSIVAETPPPSYDHFAPPSYDSLSGRTTEKGEFDVYVVPVHALKPIMEGGAEGDTPPSYGTAGRA